jgi:flagella basal body P-ring formation protein FlgA
VGANANDMVVAMTDKLAGSIYVVATSKGNMTVYWAAATQQSEAVAIVQKRLPPGWTAILTDRQLTPDQVTALKLRPGDVRQLKFRAMFGGK